MRTSSESREPHKSELHEPQTLRRLRIGVIPASLRITAVKGGGGLPHTNWKLDCMHALSNLGSKENLERGHIFHFGYYLHI